MKSGVLYTGSESHIVRGRRVGPHRNRGRKRFLLIRRPATRTYSVQASAPQLTQTQPVKITLKPGSQILNLTLKVATIAEKVTVQEDPLPH